jgi:hypothetical protein
MNDPIRRLATVTDEEAARHVSGGTRADLAEQIMATPYAPARRRRRVLFAGLPLAAVAAGAAALIVWFTASGGAPHRVQPAALSFSTSGKYLVVKVKDPYADPKRYAKEFAAHGMKIRLTMLPASPSIVGTVVFMDGGEGITTITAKGKCWMGGGGYSCPVGVKIPIGYHKEAGIAFGRPARPGEQYESSTDSFAPGEELHCVDLRGRTVAQAIVVLKRHRMVASQYRPSPGITAPAAIPGGWYVADALPWSPGQVLLWVQPTKPGAGGEFGSIYRGFFKGCR